jgi:hypothetical protein
LVPVPQPISSVRPRSTARDSIISIASDLACRYSHATVRPKRSGHSTTDGAYGNRTAIGPTPHCGVAAASKEIGDRDRTVFLARVEIDGRWSAELERQSPTHDRDALRDAAHVPVVARREVLNRGADSNRSPYVIARD